MKYVVKRMPLDELSHHGIKGQHWGVRHFQKEDGTWTDEGQKRYSTDTDGEYGEPNGERKKERHVKVESNRTPKKLSKRQLKKAQKQAIKEAKKEQLRSERTMRLVNTGFKALNAYDTWKSIKEDWI